MRIAGASEEAEASVVREGKAGRGEVNRDGEQRLAAELAAMRESEERLRLALGAAFAGVWEWNVQTGAIIWSPENYELYGLDKSVASPGFADWERNVYPEDLPGVHEAVRSALEGRCPAYEGEFRVRHPQKGERWILGLGRVERAADGTPLRMSGINIDVTERKRAEEAAREQAALLNLAHDAIIVRGAGDKITYWNRGAQETYGWTAEEAMGQVTHTFLRTRSPKPLAELSAELVEKDQWEGELTHIRKDGREIVVASRWAAQRDRDGRQVGVLEINRDITERKRAEQALREGEERFKKSFKSSPAALVISRLEDGQILEVNEAFANLVGHRRQELIGRRSVEAGLIGLQERAALIKTLTPEGKLEQREMLLKRSCGQSRWVLASAERIRLGREACIIWTGFDITDRKRAEEALRVSEEQFRATFNVSSVGKAQCDPVTGRFLRVNAAYCRITGYMEAELLTRTVADITHPEDREEDWASYSRMGSGQDAGYETEKRYVRRDGRVIWVHVCANLIRDAAGRALRTSAVIQDITERKAFQAELERLVAERTAKLQELVGELEHFSYTITHDLKSPLRAMRGFAEMASRMCADSVRKEVKEALAKISISAERMDGLIADALNYSRSLRQELPLTEVDTGALLRGMLDSYPELQPSRAHIQVEGELPVVRANEAGLTQCFSNLLGNAVKFVKREEKPQIRVWAEERGGWARLWVEDKGIGISKEMLPRVFEMFSRGSKDYEGTGIGLALVRTVAHRMGGRAGVESEEGKGSRFWIELNVGEVRAKPGRVEVAPAEPKGGTVLYVEDEESDAMFMRMAFAGQGMESALRVVGDGRAAIEYLSGAGKYADRKEYPLPSVVLLDLNLPQVPGFGVLKWMRNHPDFARTPVVVFSSSTREDDRVKALELGANEFVGKPGSGLKFGEVVERLKERWLGEERKG